MYEVRFFVNEDQILDPLPAIDLEAAKRLKALWDEILDGRVHLAKIYKNGELI